MMGSGVTEGGYHCQFSLSWLPGNTNLVSILKNRNDFRSYPRRELQQFQEEKPQIIQGKYFVNHSFSGFEN